MASQHVINVDLAEVYASEEGKGFIRTLGWGDEVEVLDTTEEYVEIRTTRFEEQQDGSIVPVDVSGFIVPSASSDIKPEEVFIEREDSRVLKIDFVDVQQGDASVVETPGGQVVFIDGGEQQLFARYLANRYRGTSEEEPKEVDCILVSHGDADHFAGLVEIKESETHPLPRKRLFIHPRRVYHNGLVKRPSSVREAERLGRTVTADGTTIITELETDLLEVDDAKMNEPFLGWKETLEAYRDRGPIEFRRLAKGDDDAFDFLGDEGVEVEVFGPLLTRVGDEEGLKFLGEPESGPRIGHHSLEPGRDRFTGKSASHTINGHSVVLRLTYGDFRFLFSGDLNEEAELELVRAHEEGELDLRAEVLKAPHHGSHDFLPEFIQAASPVVSVVSSGDESPGKEYIHPRATLMGALGKYSRVAEPLIFVTELVAFFRAEKFVTPEFHELEDGVAIIEDGEAVVDREARGPFFAFSRTAFGLVMVRTDGERLLVYTNSGQADLKEAYVYRMDAAGEPVPEQVRKA
jgi:glyoxylase-like metal-dependent hydrolase (beta-lactamase superfamily II)